MNLMGLSQNQTLRQYGLVWLGYFGFLVILRGLSLGLDSLVSMRLWVFVVGGALGMAASYADRLVYVYYSHPEEPLSQEVRGLMREKKWMGALAVLQAKRHQQWKLAMSNVLFLGAWVGLAFFLLTSSPSAFGKGLVLGIGLQLCYQMITDWEHKNVLRQRLFWPIKRKVSDEEMKVIVFGFVGVFALISLVFGYQP